MQSWFSPIRPRSLRGQLIALFAALAVPLVALQGWWSYNQYQVAAENAEAQSLVLADATATSVRQFFTRSEQMMTTLAAQFGPEWASGGCVEGTQMVARLVPSLVNVIALDADGDILCSAREAPDTLSARGWSWLPTLLETGQFTVGDPVLGTLSGEWILPIVVPVRGEDGSLTGAIAGSVPLLELDQILSAGVRDQGHLVTTATADGVIVARSHDAAEWIGQTIPALTGVDEEIEPGRWIARGPDLNGIDRAWGQVRTPNGWIVYVGVPAADVYGPVYAMAVRNGATTLVVILLSILLAGSSYRRIAEALRELASGVRLSDDGMALALPEGTPTEVRAIVERFHETLQSRDRAEAAERKARERYQSIIDNAIFGLYVSTLDGRFLQVNPALTSMLGYSSAEALVEAGPAALYSTPARREELAHRAARLGVIEDWEVEWRREDGIPINVRLNGRMVPSIDGAPAFEMIVQDITEEKRREDELRQTQKMEAIGKLAGGIAHDFNNLLTVIGGNLELIQDGLEEGHPLHADIGQIQLATERASSLTLQLLAFSRKEPRGARPLDLNEILANMERMLVRLIGEDVRLQTKLPPDLPPISMDTAELEQIVMNLVLNARDAMPAGGSIEVETRAAAINTGSGVDSRTVDGLLLSVRDGGLGMDFETSKRIFEPFYTTKPMGKGTGLGLSTVYGIVQRAGGHIGVESEPGRGTTIDIWFPITRADADTEQEVAEISEAVGGNETILVVEDEELVRVFVRRALEEAGYAIVVASDGQEALEVFEALDAPVDLVLTDVVMPRMKGPELAERLSTLSPETPVLYMSGYVHNQALSGQLAENPDILLRKPFSTTELCERVRFLLDRRRPSERHPENETPRSKVRPSR